MPFKLPKTMRAAVYRDLRDVRIETVPVPRIGRNELLVRVMTCGVCPTDVKKIYHGTVPAPRVFGHETAGIIVRKGNAVRGFELGQRVALHHHVPCLDCHACRHASFAQCPTYKRTGITAGFEPAGGGFSEYVRVMPFVFPGLVPIPKRNSFEEGALLEPVNTVLKGILRLNLLPKDNVWIIGQGPVGLIFTGLLASRQITVTSTDLLEERLPISRQFGARHALLANAPDTENRLDQITKKRGFDAVIVAVPSDLAVQEAQRRVRGGGQILLFAHTIRGASVSIDPGQICADEKDLIGSYSSDYTLQKKVARLVFSRQLDVRKLVRNRFPLEQSWEAIQLAAQPTPDSLKIMIHPPAAYE